MKRSSPAARAARSATRGLLSVLIPCVLALVARAGEGRVIVLGFDGADARTVAEMMDGGQLPNFARLRATGTSAPLATTMPAESPVSWAALNSGQNPGKTGIPGFVKRGTDPDSGLPAPDLGHIAPGPRRTDTLALAPWQRVLVAHDPLVVALGAGLAPFVVFLFVFAFLLKVRKLVAVLLAALLGGAGAWGGFVASGYLPREIASVVGNPTRTAGFWEEAARHGVRCVVIDAAMAWDRPPADNLKLLAGLGVPDVRGQNGDWFMYTTSDEEIRRAPEGRGTSTAGRVFRVDERDGRIESWVYGPQNVWLIDRAKSELRSIGEALGRPGLSDAKVERLRARRKELTSEVLPRLECRYPFDATEEGRSSLPLVVERRGEQCLVSIGGQSQTLSEGAWSGWYHLTFELNPLLKVRAITRVKLVKRAAPFELFVDFLQIDPSDPVFWQPVSQPAGFAAELARSIREPYETVGWACLTMPLKDREVDPITFLEDIEHTQASRVKLLMAALARDDWRILVDVESTPDRVQHMMYQFVDTRHPLYDATKAARRTRYFGRDIALSEAIAATYREMDRVVGEVVERHLRPEDTLIVCADHGFQSFRRQVALNNWLAREGYLVLKDGVTLDDASGLSFVDWARTRAYAVGLGMIYVNQQGREREGIVPPEDVPALLADIRAKLSRLEDPDLKTRVVREVYEMAKIHSGPHVADESDLMVGFEAGWRVSWSSTLGNMTLVEDQNGVVGPGPVFTDNRSPWSGDHVSVAEDLVRGIFFSNRKVTVPKDGLNLLDIAPTVLDLVGVPVPAAYDRAPLSVAR